jgi:hypothetical protein
MPKSKKRVSKKISKSRSKSKPRGSNYKVQSIVIPMSLMSESEAKEWVKKHHKLSKIEISANTYRFQQLSPEKVKSSGYTHFKVKKLPNGVELVLAYKHLRK